MKILITLIVLLWSVNLQAQTWYVNGTTGHDTNNDCTEAQNPNTPKRTITNALDNCFTYGAGASANKVLEVAAGTYTESVNRGSNFPRGSSMDAPFTMRAAPGATVIIRPSSGPALALNSDPGWVAFNAVIQGFTFDGSNNNHPTVSIFGEPENEAHDLNVRVTGNTFTGNNLCITNSFMANGTNLLFDHNIMNSGTSGNLSDCGGYPVYHGGNNGIFEYNEMLNFPTYAIHLFQTNPPGSLGCPSGGIIRYNTFHDQAPTDDFDGVAVACGHNHKIYGNIIWNAHAGIGGYINTNQLGFEVYNNVIVNTVYSCIEAHGQATVRNNICWNESGSPPEWGTLYGAAAWNASHNLCNSGCNDMVNGGIVGTGTSINGQNPRFVDAPNRDFRLCRDVGDPHPLCTGTSPALNTGTNVSVAIGCTIGSTCRDFAGTLISLPYSIGAYDEVGNPPEPPPEPDPMVVLKTSCDNRVDDQSGNNNHGVLTNGATYTASGKYNQGCSLDGINDSITISDSNSLDLTHGATFAAWVYPTSVANDSVILVKNPNSKMFLFASIDGYCGTNSVMFGFSEGGTTAFACYSTPLPINTWTHVAGTYNRTLLSLYINGSLVTTAPGTTVLSGTTGTQQIGASGFGEFFTGFIDEIWIFNCALGGSTANTCVVGGQPQTIISLRDTPINAIPPPAPSVSISFGASASALSTGAGSSVISVR